MSDSREQDHLHSAIFHGDSNMYHPRVASCARCCEIAHDTNYRSGRHEANWAAEMRKR